MAVALSYATEPAYVDDYDWCSNYYNYYHDPRCAYLYDYPYSYFVTNRAVPPYRAPTVCLRMKCRRPFARP